MKPVGSAPARLSGFTLVEIMVAMVIGMIGIIIMMQVFSTTEGRKRTTTGTSDAQSIGAMAIYDLQHDIRQSGYGFNALGVLNCRLALGAPANTTIPAFAPTIINPKNADGSSLLPDGDAGTDTVLVAFGNSSGSPEGDAIVLADGVSLAVQSPGNFSVNDWVIAAPIAEVAGCALTLNRIVAVAAPRVTVALAGAVAGSNLLFNLGNAPTIRAYAIRGGRLTFCDFMTANCAAACTAAAASCSDNWIPMADNIVSLRAQYGRDTDASSGIDSWDQVTPTSACQWVRASALRLAIVARVSQVEKGDITGEAPTWEGSATAAFDLSGKENWQHYRYKVFETVVPIRNLPWMAKCT